MQDALPFSLRGPVPEDLPFIMKSWMSKTRHCSFVRNIPNDVFTVEHHNLVEKLLRRSNVLVACNPQSSDHVYGYLVWEPEPLYIHFIFVKSVFRKLGVARHLLSEAVPALFTPDAPKLYCSHANELFNPMQVLDSEGKKTGVEKPNYTVQRYRLVFNPYPALKA